MLPNLLIILGIAIAAFGTWLKFSGSEATAPAAIQQEVASTTASTPEAKGLSFEKWVVDHLSKDFQKLREWRGDKISDTGTYAASNERPDLEVDLVIGKKSFPFAMECKWRQNFSGVGVDVKGWQLTRYRRYAEEQKIPTFLVLGIGGTPSRPAELYIVPLLEFNEPNLTMANLAPYRQPMQGHTFYFDAFTKKLRY